MSRVIAMLLASSFLALLYEASFLDFETTLFFFSTLGLPALLNTLFLLVSVTAGATVLGAGAAYLVANYEFRGRTALAYLTAVPLAIPTYIMAAAHLDSPYSAVVNTLPGTSLVLIACLYPYVYLTCLPGFRGLRWAQRDLQQYFTLGKCLRVLWPMCRPAIYAGAALVFMDALTEFGAVSVLNQLTVTTLIYKAWFNYRSTGLAAAIGVLYSVFAMVLYFRFKKSTKDTYRLEVPRAHACWPTFALSALVGVCFVWPIGIMLSGLTGTPEVADVLHSFEIALAVSTFCIVAALCMMRRSLSVWIATSGYSIPSTILALIAFCSAMAFDRVFDSQVRLSVITLVFAISMRYLTVAHNTMFSQWQSVGRRYQNELSQYFPRWKVSWFIHGRMQGSNIAGAFGFVFLEVFKELPITLMLRPYNFDTLSTRVYDYTSEGMYQEAYGPALVLVFATILLGAIGVFIFTWVPSRLRQAARRSKPDN